MIDIPVEDCTDPEYINSETSTLLSACASSRSLNFLLKDSFCLMILHISFTNLSLLFGRLRVLHENMFSIWILRNTLRLLI